MGHESTNISPTKRQAAFFRKSLISSNDITKSLTEFKDHFNFHDGDRWCTLNAVLVAVAAILLGKESSYKVYSGSASTSKGGSHVAGAFGREVYDLAALQYGPDAHIVYSPSPAHFREKFLEAARESLESPLHNRINRTTASIRALLRLERLL